MRPTTSIEVLIGRPDEYERAKRLLNAGRHPAFIGRSLVRKCATNGGLFFFQKEGCDCAVAAMQTRRSVLLVLNVHPSYRGQKIGEFVVNYLRPNFARVVESAVPWFERQGYVGIGEWKVGIRYRTRVMVRKELIGLAGRLRSVLERSQ